MDGLRLCGIPYRGEIRMCDPDCRKRFIKMELELATMTTDIKWIKKLMSGLILLIATFFGIDLTGVV